MFSLMSALRLLAVALLGAGAVCAAVVQERSVGTAQIRQIAPQSAADLVILDAGHEAGLREGMVCTVSRSGQPIGELLLVELRTHAASALILDLIPDQSLLTGDRVSVKTVSSR